MIDDRFKRTEAVARDEIVELHVFFQRWFRGELPNTDEAYADFADRLAPGFAMVTTSGTYLDRDSLLAGMRGAHGTNPEFEIEVRDVTLIHADGTAVTARYQELQWNAVNSTPAHNARWGTVLFGREERRPSGLTWRWLQETALPTG